MATRCTILYLITSTTVGGAEKALFDLVRKLDRKEFKIYVCSVKKAGSYADKIAALTDGFYSLNLREAGGVYAFLNAVYALMRLILLIRSLRPTIIHSFLFRANILGRIAGRIEKVPVIISSVRVIEPQAWYKHLIDRLTAPFTDYYIAVSDAARNHTIKHTGIPPHKITTIYNGIDNTDICPGSSVSRAQLPVPEDAKVIALIGRFHKQKGHLTLIEAVKMLLKELPACHVLFAGEGAEEVCIRTAVEEAGLSEHIHFLGVINNVAHLLPVIDIVVLPSLWEGLPNIVLEAMAVGLPVVASRIEGMDEVVLDGETGILFTPGDSQSLSKALRLLMHDEQMAKRMGATGRKHVKEKFQLQKTVQQTLHIYDTLLNRGNQTTPVG
ncbi:MAG: glycosyltransferase [Proteobacteria bacterium]|nr:glycosyltransferase [Pseudomonadota bacterium]